MLLSRSICICGILFFKGNGMRPTKLANLELFSERTSCTGDTTDTPQVTDELAHIMLYRALIA
jgi:hypothetical protein